MVFVAVLAIALILFIWGDVLIFGPPRDRDR